MWPATILFLIVFADTSDWVNSDCNEQELQYMLQSTPYTKFHNQIIVFKGVYNEVVGDIQTHFEKQSLTVTISSESPHSFYKDKPYICVEVYDNSGKKIYYRIAEGLTSKSCDEVPMQEGFQIRIFHAEAPARLCSPDGITSLAVNRTTHRFVVTRYGLMNLALGNNPMFIFLQKLYQTAGQLQGFFLGSEIVRHVLVGARSLPQPYRTEFIMKYSNAMSECIIMFVMRSESAEQGSIAVSSKQGLQNLVGTEVTIKCGDEIYLQEIIQPQANLFNYANLYYGVYSVEFNGRGAEDYIIEPQYIEVKYNVNPVIFDLTRIDDSLLFKDIPLDGQLKYVNSKANEIAMSSFRSSIPLCLSNEKKLLLASVRCLPSDCSGPFFNRYGYLFQPPGQNGEMPHARRDLSSNRRNRQ